MTKTTFAQTWYCITSSILRSYSKLNRVLTDPQK